MTMNKSLNYGVALCLLAIVALVAGCDDKDKDVGAQVVLTGIRPEVAQTLVQLGVDLRSIITRGTLQDGITYALRN